MFRRIADFDSVPILVQPHKIEEELEELKKEIIQGNIPGILSEGADLIQTVITLFVNMGLNIEDIEKVFTDLYVKESKRGRTVVCLEGETFKDKVISDLLRVIAEKEKTIAQKDKFIDVIMSANARFEKVVMKTDEPTD